MPRRPASRTVTALLLVALAYAGVCLGAWALQRRLMYFPGPELPTPAAVGLPGARILSATSETSDRRLTHWFIPPRPDAPVAVHFHGNAGTIADRAPIARAWRDAGFGVLLVEYPGYGGNPGAPSEEAIVAGARAALSALQAEGVPPARWVLVGESLGSAVAVRMAKSQARQGVPVAAVILEAPFTSTVDVARRAYWFLPVRWLLRDRLEVEAHIGAIAAPLLIVHGGRDDIVPQALGRRLFDAAREPKKAEWIDAAGHNDLHAHGALEAELAFLREYLAKGRETGR